MRYSQKSCRDEVIAGGISMTNTIALLSLEMVRNAYEQNKDEARKLLAKLDEDVSKIIFLASERRTPLIQKWLEAQGLDRHTLVHKEDIIKRKILAFFLKFTPSNWKEYFVRSLLESMDAGRYPPADTIIFTDSDRKTRLMVSSLNDRRIKVYPSLNDIFNPVLNAINNNQGIPPEQ